MSFRVAITLIEAVSIISIDRSNPDYSYLYNCVQKNNGE